MTDSDLTSGLSTELDDHPAEFENRTPEKSIQLAESELAKKRTSSEASLSEKKHTKRARGVFDIVKNAPEPHLTVGPYQSNFRFEALIQFVELSLSNIKEARTRTNNTKILLAIASQQSGSEFGQHLLGEAKKNRDLLLQRFPKEELDYFLSAQYIYLNMSRIGDDFKKGFRSFFLECLLDHCPADKFQEAKEFWNKYSIHEISIGAVAGWFVHKLQQPLFFHFVEIDAINEGHNEKNITLVTELDEKEICRYHMFWNWIQVLHKHGFIYCSGPSQHLFYLVKEFQKRREVYPSGSQLI